MTSSTMSPKWSANVSIEPSNSPPGPIASVNWFISSIEASTASFIGPSNFSYAAIPKPSKEEPRIVI